MIARDEQRDAVMALSALPGLGPVRIGRLLSAFGGDAAAVLRASETELRAVRDIGRETAAVVRDWKRYFDLDRARAILEEHGAAYCLKGDPEYPRRLARLEEAPFGLYIRGVVPDALTVAIIGTRRPTLYGRGIARSIARELAAAGVCVVSGMARGIDTEAHLGALETGATVAVLGCGLDIVYPPENAALHDQLGTSGGLVSEFPFGRQPDQQTFPQRNRLVSGMADAVLVVESDVKGGSMITARFAGEQGRHVFAVPGRVDQPAAKGCHALIRDGATLVTCADDILAELRFNQLDLNFSASAEAPDLFNDTDPEPLPTPEGLSSDEGAVYGSLAEGAALFPDVISDRTQLPHQRVSAALMMLELKKHVAKRSDGTFEIRATRG